MGSFVLGIDQSTQGTKALLYDETGALIGRSDLLHRQYVNSRGWVSHDTEEICRNTLQTVRNVVEKAGIPGEEIRVLGISSQRETVAAWSRSTGKPFCHAVVWQCTRGESICRELEEQGHADRIRELTGLPLSPYFSAAKMAWILRNIPEAARAAKRGDLCMGTMDSCLIYHLTEGRVFRMDFSNASRTQLFNIHTLSWDAELCSLFGIPVSCLPEIEDSDGDFGETDFGGFLEKTIPIRGVLGDSNGALFGQQCLEPGTIKTTYGTGSSVMMNIGDQPMLSRQVVTSAAWKISGKVDYVLEGNINYTGAVISWLQKDLHLIDSPSEAENLAAGANREDRTYLVPAFTGLGAPYWDSDARAVFCGMSRSTGRAEIVKAGLESIAYQITDILKAMSRESGIPIRELRVDGGPTRNSYLMQFQSDIAGVAVDVPDIEELSGTGAAYLAGISAGIYDREEIFGRICRKRFEPQMSGAERERKYSGWQNAVGRALR